MNRRRRQRLNQDTWVELSFLEKVRNRCPNDSNVLRALGDLYTRSGSHDEGLRVDEHLSRLCPDESEVWYNLGCSYALVGRKDDAFSALNKAVDLGYCDYEWIVRDNDLDNLRGDPRFQGLVNRVIATS